MTEKKQGPKRIDPKTLSKKSQEKLEEIRKNQNLKSIDEAYDYLVRNFMNGNEK